MRREVRAPCDVCAPIDERFERFGVFQQQSVIDHLAVVLLQC